MQGQKIDALQNMCEDESLKSQIDRNPQNQSQSQWPQKLVFGKISNQWMQNYNKEKSSQSGKYKLISNNIGVDSSFFYENGFCVNDQDEKNISKIVDKKFDIQKLEEPIKRIEFLFKRYGYFSFKCQECGKFYFCGTCWSCSGGSTIQKMKIKTDLDNNDANRKKRRQIKKQQKIKMEQQQIKKQAEVLRKQKNKKSKLSERIRQLIRQKQPKEDEKEYKNQLKQRKGQQRRNQKSKSYSNSQNIQVKIKNDDQYIPQNSHQQLKTIIKVQDQQEGLSNIRKSKRILQNQSSKKKKIRYKE